MNGPAVLMNFFSLHRACCWNNGVCDQGVGPAALCGTKKAGRNKFRPVKNPWHCLKAGKYSCPPQHVLLLLLNVCQSRDLHGCQAARYPGGVGCAVGPQATNGQIAARECSDVSPADER